jgi:hypothetical protein
MAKFKHKKTGEEINVKLRIILTDSGQVVYQDRDNRYDLKDYDEVKEEGDFTAVRVKANPKDKAGVR